jgi:hypothetical protein
MKNNKTENTLKLLIFLSKHPNITKLSIMKEIGCDERTFYNYLHTIREVGFVVNCKTGRYTLIKKNEAANALRQMLNIKNEDYIMLHSLISKLNIREDKKHQILIRLSDSYSISTFENDNNPDIFNKISNSIQEKRNLLVRRHRSKIGLPEHFIAEIYKTDNKADYCWLYIPTEGKNYKLRISDIETINESPIHWMFSSKHLKIEQDIFGNYGELSHKISINITKEGAQKLISTYPLAKIFIKKEECLNNYLLDVNASNYSSIVSFILFNRELIININELDLVEYLHNWLDKRNKEFARPVPESSLV